MGVMFCFGICVLLWYFCTWPHVTMASEVSPLETSVKRKCYGSGCICQFSYYAFLISVLHSK